MTRKQLNKLISDCLVKKQDLTGIELSTKDSSQSNKSMIIYYIFWNLAVWDGWISKLYLSSRKKKELTYISFLLYKRAEFTKVWTRFIRFWLDKIEERFKEIYMLEKREVLPFKMMCIGQGGKRQRNWNQNFIHKEASLRILCIFHKNEWCII